MRPLQCEPAHAAQRIVMYYAVQGWTLSVLLIGLPFAVLVIGCVTPLRNLNDDTEPRQAARELSNATRLHLATRMFAAVTLLVAHSW
jgi:hypothetical protein